MVNKNFPLVSTNASDRTPAALKIRECEDSRPPAVDWERQKSAQLRGPYLTCNDRLTSIVLKNPQNALAPNSRICAATLGINADYGLKAPRKATEGEGRLLAGSPSNFRRSLCAVTGIVIDRKIRVFQHNLRRAAIPIAPAGRLQRVGLRPYGGVARESPVSAVFETIAIRLTTQQ